MLLDSIDKKLINLVQMEFPLKPSPYRELGLKLGFNEDEVIRRIGQLKVNNIIRQISPVLDTRRLGYGTTLVAMRVAENQLDKAAQLLIDHPGVSHGYERDHHFNLWFTLAIPPGADMESELEKLTRSIGAEAVFALPAVKVFKIRAYFDMDGEGQGETGTLMQPSSTLPEKVELSQPDRLIINELQQDLPLISQPFAEMAARLAMPVEDLLTHCQSLRQRGVMRRFSASISHRKTGYTANAMTCWVVPPEKVETAGQKLALLREVSHCYERRTNPLWQYNLFAMIHGKAKEECQEVASKVSAEIGLMDYVLLFSTREFKKTRVKYTL